MKIQINAKVSYSVTVYMEIEEADLKSPEAVAKIKDAIHERADDMFADGYTTPEIIEASHNELLD